MFTLRYSAKAAEAVNSQVGGVSRSTQRSSVRTDGDQYHIPWSSAVGLELGEVMGPAKLSENSPKGSRGKIIKATPSRIGGGPDQQQPRVSLTHSGTAVTRGQLERQNPSSYQIGTFVLSMLLKKEWSDMTVPELLIATANRLDWRRLVVSSAPPQVSPTIDALGGMMSKNFLPFYKFLSINEYQRHSLSFVLSNSFHKPFLRCLLCNISAIKIVGLL